jgi:NADPH:quinone reductase-like Zn-dependent oxidoreductase
MPLKDWKSFHRGEGIAMRIVVTSKGGSPDHLRFREMERPTPKDDEVLIRIHATTVTVGDVLMRKMILPLYLIFRLFGIKRKILGHELAGTIEAVGQDVTRFEAGDEVFASTGFEGRAHAEYVSLSEKRMIALKPENLTFEEAAAVPVGAFTALAILRRADIQPGQKVLIYGASGSVGTYAVQLAKHFGAKVTGVCSTANLDMVRSIGAERVIDYTQEDLSGINDSYDVVFDTVRKCPRSVCKGLLKRDGTYLTSLANIKERSEDLVFIKGLVESGELRPVIDRTYPFEEIVEAHRYVDKGHKVGNVVITLVDDS